MAVPARDIPWNPSRMEGYRTFANKLWQAERFVLMNLPEGFVRREVARGELDDVERWVLSRLAQTTLTVNQALDEFRFHEAADAIYHFAWDEYCAWFIEASKPLLFSKTAPLDERAADVRRQVLVRVLDDTLRLLHPFMPFLTEELWQHLPRRAEDPETIVRARYPAADASEADEGAIAAIGRLQEAVVAIRNLRAEAKLDPKRTIPVELVTPDASLRTLLTAHAAVIASLARTESPVIAAEGDRTGRLVAEAGAVSVRMPLAGVVDPQAESARLKQQIEKLEKELSSLQSRLSNEGFVAKAPPEVIAQSRARVEELSEQGERMRRQLASFAAGA
jgi:valyl-tRNA synthetase